MDVVNEAVLNKLRSFLKLNKVQLWKEPYLGPLGRSADAITELATSICSTDPTIQLDSALAGLDHLQTFSIERFSQNEKFKTHGIATLRLQFVPKTVHNSHIKSVEAKLSILGSDLCSDILTLLNSDVQLTLKLIFNGRLIDSSKTLLSQGVGHNKTVLCLAVPAKQQDDIQSLEEQISAVKKSKQGAKLLASSSDHAARSFDAHITDQKGRTLEIPANEKTSLVIALSLHEKGRLSLKNKNYSNALIYLLEADSEFKQCRSDILESVDNFAVLCLDISWCYLCLKNLSALSDVDDRLSTCEKHFNRCYGENLQRLFSIKGGSGNEVTLFVKLYILQGIVAYYKGDYSTSKQLLDKAEGYAASISVNEDQVVEMVALGFDSSEARSALRTCNGNLQRAVEKAYKIREEKDDIEKEEKEKARKRKLAIVLGKCNNNEDVDVDAYERLINILGFEPKLAQNALKSCDNDINAAIDWIQNNRGTSQASIMKEVSSIDIMKVNIKKQLSLD